jgi:hypothetical protein
MSDTPETKAFKTRIRGIDGDKYWVPAGFSEILERERDKARRERDEAIKAIRETLEENRHLADGDDCTLRKLKAIVPDWK